MIEYNTAITNALSANLTGMGEALNKSALIPRNVAQEANQPTGMTYEEKAAKMRNIVTDKVELNPDRFNDFCDVLEKNEQGELATTLRDYCTSLIKKV